MQKSSVIGSNELRKQFYGEEIPQETPLTPSLNPSIETSDIEEVLISIKFTSYADSFFPQISQREGTFQII